jgi:ketosteroid isomerase-like protein
MANSTPEAGLKKARRTIDRERDATTAGDRTAYFAVLADDAVFMPPGDLEPGSARASGRKATTG